MSGFEPVLIGAAVGAGTSALTGGNILKGGLLGGVTGGVGNYLKGALLNGVVSNAVAGGDPVKGLAINASLLGGSQGFGTALPGAVNTAQTASGLAQQGISAGLPIQGFAGTPSGMSPLNAAIQQAAMQDPTGFASTITNLPANAATQFGGSTGAKTLVEQSLFSSLKDYMPSGQALTQLGTQALTPRPVPAAPSGGITAGRAPDMAAITELLKRRQPSPASLLSNYFG